MFQVGSIGVISATFGATEAAAKLGIERVSRSQSLLRAQPHCLMVPCPRPDLGSHTTCGLPPPAWHASMAAGSRGSRSPPPRWWPSCLPPLQRVHIGRWLMPCPCRPRPPPLPLQRVYTAGEAKVQLDPFLPVTPEAVRLDVPHSTVPDAGTMAGGLCNTAIQRPSNLPPSLLRSKRC